MGIFKQALENILSEKLSMIEFVNPYPFVKSFVKKFKKVQPALKGLTFELVDKLIGFFKKISDEKYGTHDEQGQMVTNLHLLKKYHGAVKKLHSFISKNKDKEIENELREIKNFYTKRNHVLWSIGGFMYKYIAKYI